MNKGKINFAIPIDRKSTTMFDERLCGKRIKLIHTDDPNSRLKEGDMGTVKCTFLNLNKVVINVQWDSGNNLGLIVGKSPTNYKMIQTQHNLIKII